MQAFYNVQIFMLAKPPNSVYWHYVSGLSAPVDFRLFSESNQHHSHRRADHSLTKMHVLIDGVDLLCAMYVSSEPVDFC